MLRNSLLTRIFLAAAIFAWLALSGSCGRSSNPIEQQSLTPDEQYLVDTYIDITTARTFNTKEPLVADSLFALIDSTADAELISNTIDLLNSNPDRWIVVFSAIEKALKNRPPGEH
jgi:hypothetical protein